MLIRTTRHACFVSLRNGLTLELCYDLTARPDAAACCEDGESISTSQGVWMFQEEVVLEVEVGQA
jgi:hypothetical protein